MKTRASDILLPFVIFIMIVLVSAILMPSASAVDDNSPDAVLGVRNSFPQPRNMASNEIVVDGHGFGGADVSSSDAVAGKTVRFTAHCKDGYELAGISVIASDGSDVPITWEGGPDYSFTMPRDTVVIDINFQMAV